MGSPFSTQHPVSGEGAEICFKDLLQAVGSQLFRAVEHFQSTNIGEQETLPQTMPSIQNCPWFMLFSSKHCGSQDYNFAPFKTLHTPATLCSYYFLPLLLHPRRYT